MRHNEERCVSSSIRAVGIVGTVGAAAGADIVPAGRKDSPASLVAAAGLHRRLAAAGSLAVEEAALLDRLVEDLMPEQGLH